MQRYMFSADFHLGSRFRVFTQLKSGIVTGRAGGPRPVIDEDKLDFNQAWLDINLVLDQREKPKVTLRLGRQEMHFGTGRMVSAREGPNVRAGFDGARLIFNTGTWRIDGFAVKPVDTRPGFFDDPPDHTQSFWGVYATGAPRPLPFHVDLYYLGLRRKTAIYNQGLAPEMRHSVGGRIWNTGPPFMAWHGWEYDVEAAFQFGNWGPGITLPTFSPMGPPTFTPIGRGDIRAWTITEDVGYTFNKVRLSPKIGLTTGIASGDKDPRNPDLQTFSAPLPNGHYFGAVQQNGPENVEGIRPNFTVYFPRRAMLIADCFFFWRQNVHDALYAIPGFPLRPGGPSTARYIGTQPQIELLWPLTQHITADLNFAHFLVGQFLKESPPSKNLNYVGLVFTYRF
jgi:Alginate export